MNAPQIMDRFAKAEVDNARAPDARRTFREERMVLSAKIQRKTLTRADLEEAQRVWDMWKNY